MQWLVRRLTERSPIISDSVVMGNINIDNTICPSCDATNVRVMKCQHNDCDCRFCEFCHPNARFERRDISVKKFDSGIGIGPFCSSCLTEIWNAAKQDFQRKDDEIRRKAEEEIRRKAEEEMRRVLRITAEAAEAAEAFEALNAHREAVEVAASVAAEKSRTLEKSIIESEIYELENTSPVIIPKWPVPVISLLLTIYMYQIEFIKPPNHPLAEIGTWSIIMYIEFAIVNYLLVVFLCLLPYCIIWAPMNAIFGTESEYEDKMNDLLIRLSDLEFTAESISEPGELIDALTLCKWGIVVCIGMLFILEYGVRMFE